MSPEANTGANQPKREPGDVPAGVVAAIAEADPPILLLVGGDAGDAVVGEVIGLAQARAAQGLATTLIDGGVTDPRLHRALGVDNLEGLADIFLFGASLPRVATRPPGHDFEFIPAGAYVPDPAGVLDSGRWDRIATEAVVAGSLLMLFVPAGTPGLGALSRRLGRAVLIGDDQDLARMTGRLERGCEVLGAVQPRAVAEPDPEAAPGVSAPAPDRELTEPLVFRTDRPPPSRTGPVVALLALVLALGAGGWFLYTEYLAMPGDRVVTDTEAGREAAPPQRRGEAVETPIPVSVAVEAHQDLTSASQRVAALRRAEPTVDFYLSPVAVTGGLYYRLLAGPVADGDTGTALLQRLVDAGHKTAFDTWAVRPTELAFHLGEYDDREDAAAQVEALAEQEIPAYIVRIRYDPGAPRFRVYGGAFETAAEAEVMQEILESAGLEARLVSRTGEPIA